MADQPWEICQYFFTEECPNLSFISKAILIPQLLDPSETRTIEKLCVNCERCRDEKRGSLRISRPLSAIIASQESTRNVKGSVLNVSFTGALVELDKWVDFRVCERIVVEIYSADQVSDYIQDHGDERQGIVKRIIKDKRQIGLMFIDEKTINQLANF